ncbi:hypothetical protein J5N97_015264 [Dioscorea zingiberensis]|uniref:AAA+ ATPase domain-containing protein n=1 Tax=Dioscorea zingiberensis TaxID=325984 RepID=A0A9D5CTX0_9LILI|nr:hypothetical protein J5N97_015264 [Dioscorea zingiberensis]
MRKRARHGGRFSDFSSILIARILETLDADAVVNRLRSLFPDYARLKLQPFSHRVHQTIQSLRRQPPGSPSSDAAVSSSRRRPHSKADSLLLEEAHLHRRRRLEKPSSSSSSDDNDDDDAFEEELRPEIDLTKSMLRDCYVKQASAGKRKPQVKKDDNVEIDTPAVSKKMHLELNEREGGSALEMPVVVERSGGGGEVRRDEGPRFSDLGGMEGVLEELMMEVIMPLCLPELPRQLGVRPITGILLHGPPGCGKTKLAHAIANETGIPFYNISATEVVSGVSGASEETIRDLFKKAYMTAPSIVFIDEIDAIAQPWAPEEMERLSITMADFEEAATMVQPSSRREGFSSIPNVKWDDIGGLHSLRNEFGRDIVRRIKKPEDYADFGVDMEAGFLLYGPPGCGKTLIAKAVANEAGANFIHIKGPELLNKYVGESELAVRTLFSRARACSPCILFFDEVDALTTKRGNEGGLVVERLLTQLLIELDGADKRQGIYVIGATNRIEVIDPAVLRPGRFGKVLYVPLPSANDRGLILKALARKKPIASNVDLDAISRREACDNLTGADLAALMNEAAMAAIEEKSSVELGTSNIEPCVIKESHFEYALKKISPSVSEQQRSYYERFSQNLNCLIGISMGLLDKLWDDTVAGPQPDTGLGKLRKPASFSIRSSSGKVEQVDEPKVTRSIMIKKPAGSPSQANGTPPSSPAGSTPPVSPFSGGKQWNRFRRNSTSDAYERGAVVDVGPRGPSPPFEI